MPRGPDDAAERLTEVSDTVDGSCTVRRYAFDGGGAGNSNRTGLETFGPAADNGCQTASAASTVTSVYDAADRLTTSGTGYDALGRTTDVPDADALGSGALTVGYHVNDLVKSIAVADGATQTYALDVDGQRVRSWTDGTTTRTNHYDGDADSPAWTAEGGTAWTRNVGGITGDLAAVYSSATSAAVLQLTNLHGDVVATAPTTSTALASTMEATEYGVPRGTTGTRYAWLGGKQRAADTPAGISLMGVRLYNPTTGRFLQTDPVYGGGANAYAYPTDPLTQYDLDGRKWCKWCGKVANWVNKHKVDILLTAVSVAVPGGRERGVGVSRVQSHAPRPSRSRNHPREQAHGLARRSDVGWPWSDEGLRQERRQDVDEGGSGVAWSG